jgi:hypothetical protein
LLIKTSVATGWSIDFVVAQSAPNEWTRAIVDATISPVPEPATYAFISLGLALLLGIRSRKPFVPAMQMKGGRSRELANAQFAKVAECSFPTAAG